MSRLDSDCRTSRLDGSCLAHDFHCCYCGEPVETADEEFGCEPCNECKCFGCGKVMRQERDLHVSRETLDDPLPCRLCPDCCRCFDEVDEPQTLGDA